MKWKTEKYGRRKEEDKEEDRRKKKDGRRHNEKWVAHPLHEVGGGTS